MTVAFPELRGLAEQFEDMLLDGEIVAMRDGRPVVRRARRTVPRHEPSAGGDPRRAEPRHADGLRPAAALRRGPHPAVRWPTAGDRSSGSSSPVRTGRCRRRSPTASCCATRPAPRASRGSSASGCRSRYHPGLRSDGLAEVPPPRRSMSVRRRRLAARDRQRRPARRGARRRARGPEGLRYLGRVGSGIAGKAGTALAEELAGLALRHSPFAGDVPREDALGATLRRPGARLRGAGAGTHPPGPAAAAGIPGRRPDLTPDDVSLEDVPGA